MNMDKIVADIRTFLPKPSPRHGTFDILCLGKEAFKAESCRDGAEFSCAYYRMIRPTVVLLLPVSAHTVHHELTHAIMDADWGIHTPGWLCEGFAELVMSVLVEGRIPPRIMRKPMAVHAPRSILYGPDHHKHYRELASHIAWLAWNEGMRHLLERFAPGGCSYPCL